MKPYKNDNPLQLKHITPGLSVVRKINWDEFWMAPFWLRKQWDLNVEKNGSKSSKEFILLLFYNPKEDQYFWYPPAQRGSSANLDYTSSEDPKIVEIIGQGNLMVGTMHNHFGKGTAFQSGADHADEAAHGMPMVHFTMGWMDSPHLYCSEFDIRFVCGEFNQPLRFLDIVTPPERHTSPEEWDEQLKEILTVSQQDVRNATKSTVNYNGKRINEFTDDEWEDWFGYNYPGESGYYGRGGYSGGYYRGGTRSMGTSSGTSTGSGKYQSQRDWREEFFGGGKNSGVIRLGDGKKPETELTRTALVKEKWTKSDEYKSIRKKFNFIPGIAGGKQTMLAKALVVALLDDIVEMLSGNDGNVAVDHVGHFFELLVEIARTMNRIDDLLDAGFKEQTDAIKTRSKA